MSKLLIVGEVLSREDAEAREPFTGYPGKLLTRQLYRAGIDRADARLTNVFNLCPPERGEVKNLCGAKAAGIPGMPALLSGKYVDAQYAPELTRLYREIEEYNPTLILALGPAASWALLGTTGLKKIRGAPSYFKRGDHRWKVLPTFHPIAVQREWDLMPIWCADLAKAKRELASPDITRPQREVWVNPTYEDLLVFERQYIQPSRYLSIDIETIGDQITCIGFAPTPHVALVVPIFDFESSHRNYWPTLEEEVKVWQWVKKICNLNKTVVGQNFLYDLSFLWDRYRIAVPSSGEDTMLLSHSLYPELQKGLAFLGSVHTDEASWKFHRHTTTIKMED